MGKCMFCDINSGTIKLKKKNSQVFEIIGRLSPQSKRTANLRFNILNLHRQLGIQIGKARIVLEKAMAPHSSTLAWKIPWMEEPGRLQSIGLLRVGHD